MLRKFDKFIASIKEEKISHVYEDYSAYTQIIKNERIRRNQTLETMAKGICSVSYLSKLENNAIKPSEDYVRALLERVNINYDDIAKNNYDTEILEVVKLYFYGNTEEIKKIYDRLYNGLFDARISMIKCFYLLSQNDFEEFFEIIEQIDEIKNSLVGYQTIILVFLVSEYYKKVSRYKESYDYLLCLRELSIDNYELKMLIEENYMISSLHLLKFTEAYRIYINYKMNEMISYPLIKKIRNDLIAKIVIGKSVYDEEELDELLLLSHCVDVDKELCYYICLNHVLNENYHKVIKIMESNKLLYNDGKFLALYGKAIYHLQKEELYKSFCEQVDNIINKGDNLKEVDKYYLSFLKMTIFGNDSYENFEYLRYTVLPYINTHSHIIYNADYEKKYVDALMRLSRYKEAANHLLNLIDRT